MLYLYLIAGVLISLGLTLSCKVIDWFVAALRGARPVITPRLIVIGHTVLVMLALVENRHPLVIIEMGVFLATGLLISWVGRKFSPDSRYMKPDSQSRAFTTMSKRDK
ncbi:hypothetical protein CKALI_04850 [Corynebacterium kalinowskii]|uniref:Uncharacterized protein n=1 Tax=Corynebacterium kalinowskii TaxID=2675216 RepID=A0A6B8W2J9_9CORY|nr:hypothetical protein CKALI_04850 [Corynebacterium kalinowskii]